MKSKALTWQFLAFLIIAEIVSIGMLSLPAALAVIGIVPGVILIVFLGVFATFTSWILIQFKLRHPEVHNMGDTGLILAGPVRREVLAEGTIIFAVFAPYCGQIVLHPAVQELGTSTRAYCSRMGQLNDLDHHYEWRSFRACRCCSHLPIPGWYCSESLRVMVHIWCRHVNTHTSLKTLSVLTNM